MPSTRRHSYDLNFKLKIVEEAESGKNNREIAREYGISESMVRKWQNQLHMLFNGELKMTAKRASMGRYKPKYPKLDQRLADWFSDQRSQGLSVNSVMLRLKAKELSSDSEFKAIYKVVQQLKTSPRCIYESENSFGSASTSRHGGEDRRIPSFCVEGPETL
nr:uncharacterized protein LOC131778898 [Pocillopora verrucosa]